jgi:predicted AAA+ superfamily ATPase
MFYRSIDIELLKWSKNNNRKPLVLRGARQVGKTTAIHQFANNFKQYIYLNLELPADRKPFETIGDIDLLVQALFLSKNLNYFRMT